MLVSEYKLITNQDHRERIGEALRTVQFIRNKALRMWYDDPKQKAYDLNRYCAVLAKEVSFVTPLNSQARQAAAERAAYAISRYLKPGINGNLLQKPRFQKDNRSVEYKQTGWKLSSDRKKITFTDGIGIGQMKMLGTTSSGDKRDLCSYDLALVKRVRVLRKADGDYVQFCFDINRSEPQAPTGKTVGLDMGLAKFYTDSDGSSVDCPKFLRKGEKKIKRAQRKHSRKIQGSKNRRKSTNRLGRTHLKIARQRKDFAVKLARCVVKSNDFVAIEDLKVRNMVKNHCLAKSISDAAWSLFANWLCYYGSVFGKPVIKVPPAYTSQDCSACGRRVWKSLSTRTHSCQCGLVLDRDHNSGIIILAKGLVLASKLYPGAPENRPFTGETLVESDPLPTL